MLPVNIVLNSDCFNLYANEAVLAVVFCGMLSNHGCICNLSVLIFGAVHSSAFVSRGCIANFCCTFCSPEHVCMSPLVAYTQHLLAFPNFVQVWKGLVPLRAIPLVANSESNWFLIILGMQYTLPTVCKKLVISNIILQT